MNDNDNQIQIISQVRRCIKSAWKIFVHLRQSSMFPRQRSTEGFQAPDFLGPVEEQELQKTINQQHHIFCHKKKCGNICVERNSNLNFCSFLGVNFLVRFLTWRVFFLDGRLAIRNGRVGKLTDITWRRGCLVCWVPNKKSLVFFLSWKITQATMHVICIPAAIKNIFNGPNVSRYHSWIVCFLNHLNVIRWFVHPARQHGPGATGWKNWIQVTTSCRTTQRHFCRVGHGQLDIPDGTATNPGKIGNSVPFDNVRTREWQWEWKGGRLYVLYCFVWYETSCWIQKAVACCVCMHAWLFLFVSGKRKLRITAGHLLDGYENLMRLAQDNLGGRAGLQRWKSFFLLRIVKEDGSVSDLMYMNVRDMYMIYTYIYI